MIKEHPSSSNLQRDVPGVFERWGLRAGQLKLLPTMSVTPIPAQQSDKIVPHLLQIPSAKSQPYYLTKTENVGQGERVTWHPNELDGFS